MDEEELINQLKDTKIPVHDSVNAIFGGTQALFQAATRIRNVIIEAGNKNDFEQAVAGTYFRMHLMVESLTRLNNKRDFQVALQITRTLYESYIDLIELKNDPTKVEKFFAFGFVAKFGAAKKLVQELTKQGITDPDIGRHERRMVSDPKNEAKYEADLKKYWANGKGQKKHPLSWSDVGLPTRAQAIGDSEIIRYRTIYSLLCWFSHGGLVGVVHMSPEALESSMGYAHAHAQEIFCDATNVIADIFKVYVGEPRLKAPVNSHKQAIGRILAAYAHHQGLEDRIGYQGGYPDASRRPGCDFEFRSQDA